MSNLVKISDAARMLHIGSKTLFKKLRDNHVLGANNVALPEYVDRGLFVVDFRQHGLRGGYDNIKRHYAITLVTPKGLSYLEELVGE